MTRSARKPSKQRRPSSKKIDSRDHQYLQGKPQLPFSDAVLAGDTLYLSGRIGLDTKNNKVPDDVEAEARYMLEDVRSVLARANMKMSDLVYVQVFCTDISLWERFNAVYRTFFDGQMPARAFLGTGTLLFGAHFEIQGIAVRR
jgi:reactive intermediate/imine deaminase